MRGLPHDPAACAPFVLYEPACAELARADVARPCTVIRLRPPQGF